MIAASAEVLIPFRGSQRVAARKCGPADLDVIADWTDVHLNADYFFRRGHLRGILTRPTNDAYAVLVDGRMCGFLVIYRGSTLHNLYLSPEFRKCGIGGAILDHFQPRFVRAKTNMSGGDPAQFYKQHGYKAVSADAKLPHIILMERATMDSPLQTATSTTPPQSVTLTGKALQDFVKFCRWQHNSKIKQKLKRDAARKLAGERAQMHLAGSVPAPGSNGHVVSPSGSGPTVSTPEELINLFGGCDPA